MSYSFDASEKSVRPQQKKRTLAALSVITAAALWGLVSLFVLQLDALAFGTGDMLFFRSGYAVILIGLFMLFYDRRLFKLRPRDLWIFVGSGVSAFGMFSIAYSEAIRLSSPAIAAALLYTAPAFVILMSTVVFREKITKEKWIAVGLTVVGSMTVSGIFGGYSGNVYGIFFGLLSGFGYALYTIFGRIGVRRYHTMTVTFYTFLFSTLFSLPFCKLWFTIPLVFTRLDAFLSTLLYSVISCVLPYLLYTAGLKNLDAGVAGILSTVEPAVAACVGICLLNESVTPYKLVGIFLILLGVLTVELLPRLLCFYRKKQTKRDKPHT